MLRNRRESYLYKAYRFGLYVVQIKVLLSSLGYILEAGVENEKYPSIW